MNIKLVDPEASGRRRKIVGLVAFVGIIFFMGNLSALVDYFLHPEISFFDEGHFFVGTTTSVLTALILVVLFVYISNLERALRRQTENEKALEESEEKFRNLFENSMDAVFIKDSRGKFTDVNAAAIRMFGYDSREEILSLNVDRDLYRNQDSWFGHQRLIDRQGFVENYESEMKKKSGEAIIVTETSTAVYDRSGNITGYCGTMRDVTAQKLMEKEIRRSQQVDSVGRMAGSIAHDFNNYLTTIKGETELAIDCLPQHHAVIGSLNAIIDSVDRASGLTRELLLFSQNQPVNMEPIEIGDVLNILEESLPGNLPGDISVELRQSQECTVDADLGSLKQVIDNIIAKSVSTMPRGGRITISTDCVTLDERYAMSHKEAYPGTFMCMTLEDDGAGMDGASVKRMFEPFGAEKVEGRSAIALAVSYGLVMQYGGWIEVKSQLDAGTIYRLFLPLSQRRPAKLSSAPVTLSGQGERILLVEDELAVRNTIERMLNDNGYIVVTAPDAEAAFDRFVREKGDIQLVFSDVVLPGQSGVELAEHLRSHRKTLPVILSSGYADAPEDLATIREKHYRFLQKPFSLPDLLKTVRELLETAAAPSLS